MKISISKFGDILVSRPAGKEAFQQLLAYSLRGKKPRTIELDFKNVLSLAPSWLDEFVTGLRKKGFKIKYLPSKNPSVLQSIKTVEEVEEPEPEKKLHFLRLCPLGEHWVRVHPRKVNISKKNPSGITEVDGHCCRNKSRKDSLYTDEILEMFERSPPLSLRPPGKFKSKKNDFKKKADLYDEVIVFWTYYWNEIFKPSVLLEPNIIKALIGSESSFEIQPKKTKAIGLMQILPKTVAVLGDFKGELADHLVHVTRQEMENPVVNIAAGIRWLFYKKKFAENRFKREVSWEEAVAAYKSYLPHLKKGMPTTGMDRYSKLLEELNQ